jgi:hypothetical protein
MDYTILPFVEGSADAISISCYFISMLYLYSVLGSCFRGGRSLTRPRNRWEDAIQRDSEL